MKTINLKPIKTALIILLFGASSCHNNSSQETTSSSADSIANRSSVRVVSSGSDSARKSVVTSTGSTDTSSVSNRGNRNMTHSWFLEITPSTSKSYLDSIEAIWKKDNIVLSISKLKYDNGNLVKIKGSVIINTKAGNHASGEFKSENLAAIKIKVDDSPNVSIKGN